MKIVFLMFLSMFVIDGVFGVDPNGVKTVMEGDSVTLQTDFSEIQKDGITEWQVNNTNIATLKGTGEVEYSDKLMFSGRLDLDQTGFLTIWNIRIKHSGEYKVESISSAGTKSRTFKVIVKESPLKSVEDKDEIKVLSATMGSSKTLHTETELQKHDLILWRFGAEGSLIAKADTEDNHITYYDGRFKGRLMLDSKTGSLTITDLKIEHTGEFRLKIISDRRILFKRFSVTFSVLDLSPGTVAGICLALLLFAAAAVAISAAFYGRTNHFKLVNLMSKISKQVVQMSKMTEQLDQMTKITEQINKMDKVNFNDFEKELYEKLKRISENYEKALPKVSKQLKRLRDQRVPERLLELYEKINQMNETETGQETYEPETSQQESRVDVPQEETPSPEIREGEGKRIVFVETHIIKALDAGSDGESSGNELKELKEGADVTEETPRPEISEGERVRIICVEEAPMSKVLGAKSLREGKEGIEDPGVQTHGSDGRAPEIELKEESSGKVKEETPLMSQKEEDGSSA